MEILEKVILEKGYVEDGNVIKVDSFLNHQIDVDLMNEIGKEFFERFKDDKVTKIMTLEASGIAIAVITAQYFKVPVVFAKKVESKNLDKEVYESEVFSYTKGKSYKIMVSKKYLAEDDNVLLVDDFLAQGQAAFGMMDLLEQAGASLAGIGIVIEKGFQEGGNILRGKKIRVESLATIMSFENDKPIFK